MNYLKRTPMTKPVESKKKHQHEWNYSDSTILPEGVESGFICDCGAWKTEIIVEGRYKAKEKNNDK